MEEKIFAPEESHEFIRGGLIHARKGWKKQEEAARKLESQYRKIGIVSVILSTSVGASLFSSLEAMYEPWSRIIAGTVSIAAAVLASLITFQRYEERAEKHRASAVNYKAVLRTFEHMHMVPQVNLNQESLTRIKGELDEVEKDAPVVPQKINDAVEWNYQSYSFVAKAADLRPVQEAKAGLTHEINHEITK